MMLDEGYTAEALFRKMQEVWRREWAVKDYCLEITADGEGFTRAVAKEINMGHQQIIKNACLAKRFPEKLRSPELAPRTHWQLWRDNEALPTDFSAYLFRRVL